MITVITGDKPLRYVGSSFNVRNRLSEHLRRLRKGKHDRKMIQRAYEEYGEPKFQFEMLEECGSSVLPEREKYWIENLEPEFNKTSNTSRPTGWVVENDDIESMYVPPWDPLEKLHEQWREINAFNPIGLDLGNEVSPRWVKFARDQRKRREYE